MRPFSNCRLLRMKALGLTEDSQNHAAGSHLPADLMGHGALVGTAVLWRSFHDKESVDDLVGKDVLGVNGLHRLQEEGREARL